MNKTEGGEQGSGNPMTYTVNRLTEGENITTSPVITGYQEIMNGDTVEEVFAEYRHYYADSGGFFWRLCATDETGKEYFQEGTL